MRNFEKLERYFKAKSIAEKILDEKLPEYCYYHSKEHSINVLNAVLRMSLDIGIDDENSELLAVAAMYHDIGHIIDDEEHEQHSCDILREELKSYYSFEELNKICSIIMATKVIKDEINFYQNPGSNILFKIICDADLDSLGRDDFLDRSEDLYKENCAKGIMIDKELWWKSQFFLVCKHHYFTESNENFRREGIKKNREKVKNILKEDKFD